LPFQGKRLRSVAVALGGVGALVAGLFAGLGPAPSIASSHREAPLVAADPQIDGTDLYAYVPNAAPNSVVFISNWIPFESPAGGPNFYAFATNVNYDINIDNNGDAVPDVIYRWTFKNHYRNPNTFLYNTGPVASLTSANLNFYQTYDLREIRNTGSQLLLDGRRVVPSYVGAASMPNYSALFNQGVATLPDGGRTWVGQADDPFFLDLRVFDLLYGANFSEVGDDTLAGFNVHSMVLQVPKSDVALRGEPRENPVIGVWTTAQRQSVRTESSSGHISFSGSLVQVSRLGMPLVNEVVVPVGLKDAFNHASPVNDHTNTAIVNKVVDPELSRDINAIYGLPIPDCGGNPNDGVDRRCDLFPVYLTGLAKLTDPHLNEDADAGRIVPYEALRLNLTVPPCTSKCSRLGVIAGDTAGFPNGRRLTDDIIDVSLQVVEGLLINGEGAGLGDGVDHNDVAFPSTFPYLAQPHSGSSTMLQNRLHAE
jgi:hypothetical protein